MKFSIQIQIFSVNHMKNKNELQFAFKFDQMVVSRSTVSIKNHIYNFIL